MDLRSLEINFKEGMIHLTMNGLKDIETGVRSRINKHIRLILTIIRTTIHTRRI